MATSNRQEFRQDDERFQVLKDFIHTELKNIQREWTRLRNDSGEKRATELLPFIKECIDGLVGDDRKVAKKMFGRVNEIFVDDDKKRKEILSFSILAFEKLKYLNRLSLLESLDLKNLSTVRDVFLGVD